MQITDVDNQTLTFIKSFSEKHGYPPTMKDMSYHFDITVGAVVDRLKRLEDQGKIKRARYLSRGITIMEDV